MTRATARWAVALGAASALVTAAVTRDAAPAGSPWRHGYLLVVAVAGARLGTAGGVATVLAAVLLDAPFVVSDIERSGLTSEALEGLVTLTLLLPIGLAAGLPASAARRLRRRHEAFAVVHAVLAADLPLDLTVARLGERLCDRLEADVSLVVVDGDTAIVAGASAVARESLAAGVLATGRPAFVPDVAADGPPRRAVVVPLAGADGTVGVLAVERIGDIAATERADLAALGAHIALAIENARLVARQRRFAHELKSRIAEATAQLAEADRMKSEFVAVASHELRTPLTAIHGFSELLATRRFEANEARRLAGIIRGETERLGRIVADLLDLTRLERGERPAIRRAPVDVATLVSSVAEVLQRAGRGHVVSVDCPAPAPALQADADALDRVLKNLIGNAMKYSPPGTSVRVAVRAMPGTVTFTVDDEGPGIPACDRERIFEPYYRGGAAPGVAGAGIGLAVVRSLVEAHGGAIRAETRAEGGTRMTVTLPSLP